MSVQTTNNISSVILALGFKSAAMGWAATALSSPIGFLGGAAFSAVREVVHIPLALLSKKLLNTEDSQASSAAKTLAKAVVVLGSYAAAWGALFAMGHTLAIGHAITLTIMSAFTSIGIAFFMVALGITGGSSSRRLADA